LRGEYRIRDPKLEKLAGEVKTIAPNKSNSFSQLPGFHGERSELGVSFGGELTKSSNFRARSMSTLRPLIGQSGAAKSLTSETLEE